MHSPPMHAVVECIHYHSSCRFTAEEKAKRPSTVYMPFGVGPRNCVGARFAMLEVKMMLIQTLRTLKFVQAPDTQVYKDK